jgi:hypothetical protein
MNARFQMVGGKNWILPKEVTANRFFWDSHWPEAVDMNGRFQMQGGKNWILPK